MSANLKLDPAPRNCRTCGVGIISEVSLQIGFEEGILERESADAVALIFGYCSERCQRMRDKMNSSTLFEGAVRP